MYWMTHIDHGTMAAYSTNEKGQLEAAGWVLLNEGEAPIHPPKVKAKPPETPEMAELNAALSRLSAAMGDPPIGVKDGQTPGSALIDFAVERFTEMCDGHPKPASVGGSEDADDEQTVPGMTMDELSDQRMGVAPSKRKYTRKAA